MSPLTQILNDVAQRHVDAVKQLGDNDFPYPVWISLLAEEVGEAAKEANWITFGGDFAKDKAYLLALRDELLDVAQLAVAAIKQIDKELIS